MIVNNQGAKIVKISENDKEAYHESRSGRKAIGVFREFFPAEGFAKQIDTLHARVLVLEEQARHAMLVLEMTSIPPEEVEAMAAILREETAALHTYVLATHTFSAPHFMPDHILKDEAERDKKRTLQTVVYAAVREAAREAAANLREATLKMGVADCPVGTARDVLTPDGWWIGNNGDGEVDRRLTALQLTDGCGNPIAVLIHYAIQSSVLDGSRLRSGGKAVSGDLAGRMAEALEGEFKVPVLFLIGAAGDQAPRAKAKTDWFEKGIRTETDLQDDAIALLQEQAAEMAHAARAALEAAVPAGAGLQHRSCSVTLPGKVINRNLRELHPTKEPPYVPEGTNEQIIELLQIGGVKLVGVKPELNCVTAREIAGNDPMVRIVTLWNGGAKYLADRESCRRITYESQNSPFYPGAAEMLAEAARGLL